LVFPKTQKTLHFAEVPMSNPPIPAESARERDRQRANAVTEQYKRLQWAWQSASVDAKARFMVFAGLWPDTLDAMAAREAENATREDR
jgi:hypothetical protein